MRQRHNLHHSSYVKTTHAHTLALGHTHKPNDITIKRHYWILTQCTMTSIPALRAHAGSVFALSMFRASGVAGQLIAEITSPARITATFTRLTNTVRSTVQTAHGYKEQKQKKYNRLNGNTGYSEIGFQNARRQIARLVSLKVNTYQGHKSCCL